ncbi:MAG: hypothetical protein WA885_12355 [Phormidesmis sp.]
MTTVAFEKQIVSLRQQIEAYDTVFAKTDAASNEIIAAKKALASTAERRLMGVATKYGRSSNEYKMAGRSRRGDRPRRQVSQPSVETAAVYAFAPFLAPFH